MNYIEYDFESDPRDPFTEILMAELGLLNFESFIETEKGLRAYIRKDEWVPSILEEVSVLGLDECKMKVIMREIEPVNWNAEWERNFTPIVVDDRCTVRASFHEKKDTEFDIIIDPKMSFGTGHHETTHLMIGMIMEMDFNKKAILDMGCGTGVLAILAHKKGAAAVTAVDIDPWSYENCIENATRNDCSGIEIIQGDLKKVEGRRFDIIIANINRNVLLEQLPGYASMLNPGGNLLLSGFYSEDIPAIEGRCGILDLTLSKKSKRNNWVALKFIN